MRAFTRTHDVLIDANEEKPAIYYENAVMLSAFSIVPCNDIKKFAKLRSQESTAKSFKAYIKKQLVINCDTGHILSSYIILCVVNVGKQRVLIYFSYPPLNISITQNVWSLYDVHGTRRVLHHNSFCFSCGNFSLERRDFFLLTM